MQALDYMSLQQLSNSILSPGYSAFLIMFDVAIVVPNSYIDFRVGYYNNVNLCNFNVLPIPIYGSHAGDAIFNLVCALLDALVGDTWTAKLTGVASDGAGNMVCKVSGEVSRPIEKCKADVFESGAERISWIWWCNSLLHSM